MTKAVVSAIKSIKGVGISSVQMTHAAGCKEVRVCSTANVITVGQRGVIRPPIPTRVELCQIVSAKVVQTSASDVGMRRATGVSAPGYVSVTTANVSVEMRRSAASAVAREAGMTAATHVSIKVMGSTASTVASHIRAATAAVPATTVACASSAMTSAAVVVGCLGRGPR